MNIFIQELKAHRKSLIFWCLGVLFMIIAGMGKFAAYTTSGQSLNELLTQIPKSIRAIMGMGDFDMTKASGFYGMLFLYLLIMTTIHASMLGANIISKEERDKTTEFLIAKPVSRTKIIAAKLLAALTNVFILNIATLVLSLAIVGSYSKGEPITGDIVVLMVGMFILQLIFLFIGTGIAAVSKNSKAATSIATAVLLLAFILSMVIDLNSKLEILKYVTPFKYFEAHNLIEGSGFEPVYVILSGLIIAALVSITFVFYKKRDLNI